MDNFKDKLKQLSNRVPHNKEKASTEASTISAFIDSFLEILGYDRSNLSEVIPQYTCDIGKECEKIDYAILRDGKPIILIECKHWKENLNSHKTQLKIII